MGRRHGRPTEHLIAAHKLARRLRRELRRLVDGTPDAHVVYLDLVRNAEAIEVALASAVGAADEVLEHDPAPTDRSWASLRAERRPDINLRTWTT